MKLGLIAILSFLPCLVFAQSQNYWVKKNNFPGLKRERTISFSLLNKGYVGMGVDTADHVLNDLWEFDAATSSWTQKASLPGSVRRNAVGFSIEKIGYVGTGMDSAVATTGQTLSDFWAYDPVTNSWTEKANFPGGNGNGIYFATGFSIDNKGYICGGKIGPNNYSNLLWEYKPSTDSWIQRSNFPGGVRYQLTSFVVNDMAYVGLGVDQNIYRKDIWQFNPANGLWTEMGDFPGGVRGAVCSFTLKERGFITLGGDGGFKKDLWEYNPYSDSWSIRSEFGGSARKNAFVFTIGDYAFVGAGKGTSGKKESVYQYVPYSLLSIEDNLFNSFQVFPTPTQGNLSVVMDEPSTISVFDLTGKLMFSESIIVNLTAKLNLHHLTDGTYILQVSNDHSTQSKKIIIY